LPDWRQALERFYRSGFGFWAYYGIEIWWRKMMFPSVREMPVRRPSHTRDCLLVTVFGVAWVAGLLGLAVTTGQSPVVIVLCGFVIPMFFWYLLMGAVVYFQHTNPRVAWYEDTAEWEATREGLSGTVLITFPKHLGRIMNNIMEHPAHHLDVRIPLYEIESAQHALDDQPTGARTQAFTWAFVVDCVRRCKLYDYAEHRWTDFAGEFTSSCATNEIPDADASVMSGSV
jgi:omega-6 fatty acid desaturase (delta-12 desaturase)